MMRPSAPSTRALFLASAVACSSFALPAAAAAQAVIKVNDDVSLKFGFLLQPQADWTQDAASGDYQKNLFLRRVRLLAGGQITPKITFFLETDDPNLGKTVAGTKTTGGFIVQDAFLEWKARDEFGLVGGLMFIPLCRNCYTSGATLLPIDYGAAAFLAGGPTRSVVGRDTGFMAHGYLAGSRLEYRLGAFQGFRNTLSTNALRSAGHLQYTFFDKESGFFTIGTYLGKKKVLTVGGGFDAQSNYKAFAGDLFFDRPVGTGGALTLEGDFIHYDGGTTFTDLPEQNDWLAQAGWLFTKARVMPWVKLEGQRFSADANTAKDQDRFQVGLSYFHRGQNANVKGGWGRINPKVGRSVNQFTLQLQLFYF